MTDKTPAAHEALAVYAPETVETDRVPPGYKQTEVGVIPEDWEAAKIGAFANILRGASPRPIDSPVWFDEKSNTGWLRISDATSAGKYLTETSQNLSAAGISNSRFVESGNLVMSICATVGRPVLTRKNVCIHDGFVVFNDLRVAKEYLYYVLSNIEKDWSKHGQTGSQMNLNTGLIGSTPIPLPPTLEEQRAIAAALSDVDALISGLDKLIAKKRAVKTAAMQQLLTGKQRLPGFSGEWEINTLQESTHCLDNLRVPLNEAQRDQMRGDYPYCGANGILDYVDDYVIDEDIILIAEDGGYFDEYSHRPIAYRMIGKCWVNNHAHILKAKEGFSQDFVYYSLVHKNILKFLASGTRAKLNKSEMYKIEIDVPNEIEEQTAIAAVLSDMDAEISALEGRREKTRRIKQAMMQELLTGRTRLV